jgi:[ribosomal protein S5]-alanine N-acetyltransferase
VDDDTLDSYRSKPDSSPAVSRPPAADLARLFGEVRTVQLVLRRPRAGDGPAMFRVHGDPETNRDNPADPDPGVATSEATLRGWLQQWEDDGFGYWAVTLPSVLEVVGFGGVRRFVWRDREVLNLYYRLVPSVWGMGYASEVARAAIGLAQAHGGARWVGATARSGHR